MAALLIVNQDRRRKQRKFRQRVSNLDEFSDQEVIARYRLDKATINELEELCRTDLSPKTYRSSSVKSMTKVLVGLRFLAKGDFLSEVADLHGISKARAATALDEFVRSVNVKLRNISFPTDRQSQTKLKRQFYEKCRIPNILGIDLQFLSPGAVDGTLIPIICPSENEAAFVCRKGYHALNVQAVCDTSMRFTDAVAMWPGSQHDSAIFNVCGLKDYLEGSQAGMLLGDSGYPLRRYLLTPKTNPSTPQEELFNNQHTKGRLAIERAFGLLKSRFRKMQKRAVHEIHQHNQQCTLFCEQDEKYSKYSERREAVLLEDIAQRIIREAEQKSGKEAGSDVVCRNVTSILGKLTDTGFYTGDINKEESDTIILETNKLFRELLDKKLLQTEPDDADSGIPDSASDISCMHLGSVTEFGEEPLMFPDTHGTSQDQKTKKRKTTDVKYESLMSMRELKNLLLTEGKTSSTLIEECDKICKFIKQLRAMDIINVWPGYKLEASNEIVFVVFTNKKIHLYLKWVVEIRVLGQGNEARKTVMELEEQNPLAKEMEVKISSVIDKYSAMLIKKHTFLSAISASSVLSQKQEKGEQEKSPVPCIVLYVLVKSIVFLTEERFPDKLDGIQVDVREGVFRFCGLLAGDFHERLRMGCKITSGLHPEKFGTLGGFIEHPEYGLCGFTCAHVCLNEEEMFELKKRKVHKDFQPEHYVFQPENGDVNKVGRLLRLIYREGNDQETGLDVAMFKIERRAPDAGIFPDKENNSATELRYDSGKVWGKLGIPSDEEKKVQKFGFVTGHTYGKIQFTNSVVSEIPYHFDIMKLKEKSITSCLFKQYHIKSTNRDIAFSKVGDSGSLVFMEDEEHDVRCIGMVVGVIEEDNSAFVTPITDILSELGVNSLKFFNHSILFATLDRRIDELENRIQDRMQQMEQRILDAVSSVTENKTASK